MPKQKAPDGVGIYKPRVPQGASAGDPHAQLLIDVMHGPSVESSLTAWAEQDRDPAYRKARVESIADQLRALITQKGYEVCAPDDPDGAPEDVRDARDALEILAFVDAEWIAANPAGVFRYAVLLGRLIERLHVRPFEAMTITGRKVRAGGRTGAKRANPNATKKAMLYRQEVQQRLDKGMKLTEAREDAAQYLKSRGLRTSYRTILRHTKNL